MSVSAKDRGGAIFDSYLGLVNLRFRLYTLSLLDCTGLWSYGAMLSMTGERGVTSSLVPRWGLLQTELQR